MVDQLAVRDCFQYQRSSVRIQSAAKLYIVHLLLLTVEMTKIKNTRPGMAHLIYLGRRMGQAKELIKRCMAL